MRHKLNQIAAISPPKTFAIRKGGLVVRLGVTFPLIGIIELPATLTRIGMQKAVSDSPQTSAEGIRFQRTFGSKDALLRSCYDRSGIATDIFGVPFLMGNPVLPGEAQKIYYRVT